VRRWLSITGVNVVIAVVGLLFARATAVNKVWFEVPSGYQGFLVTRWECFGGVSLPLANWLLGNVEAIITYDQRGAACVENPIPEGGFRIGGFIYREGGVAPVVIGGTRARQGRSTDPNEPEFVYTLASIGIGEQGRLGDECSLSTFLHEEFDAPLRPAGMSCDPIWVLPGTPPGTPVRE
jgi:hypothetical protein